MPICGIKLPKLIGRVVSPAAKEPVHEYWGIEIPFTFQLIFIEVTVFDPILTTETTTESFPPTIVKSEGAYKR